MTADDRFRAGKGKAMSKSDAAEEASEGQDMGKPGKGFAKVAAKATQEYGSSTVGQKVAGAAVQKMRKAGKL